MNRIGGGRFVRMGSRWASSAGGGSATDAASTAATAAAAAAVTSTSSYTISTPGSANGIQMGARVGGSQTRARGRVGWGAVQDQLEGRRVPARRNASGIGQPLMSSGSSVQHNGGGGGGISQGKKTWGLLVSYAINVPLLLMMMMVILRSHYTAVVLFCPRTTHSTITGLSILC